MRQAAAEEGIEFAVPAQHAPHVQHAALCLDENGFVNALDNIFGKLSEEKLTPLIKELDAAEKLL